MIKWRDDQLFGQNKHVVEPEPTAESPILTVQVELGQLSDVIWLPIIQCDGAEWDDWTDWYDTYEFKSLGFINLPSAL